ncbi:MAG: hypothetical protein QWI36_02340 [Wolbachia endosymbiont of Tyrophagus putrescentiae]|nr:hypothetical protein [Wolbachia endosymbiont of Tyrophagus putrescentiae]
MSYTEHSTKPEIQIKGDQLFKGNSSQLLSNKENISKLLSYVYYSPLYKEGIDYLHTILDDIKIHDVLVWMLNDLENTGEPFYDEFSEEYYFTTGYLNLVLDKYQEQGKNSLVEYVDNVLHNIESKDALYQEDLKDLCAKLHDGVKVKDVLSWISKDLKNGIEYNESSRQHMFTTSFMQLALDDINKTFEEQEKIKKEVGQLPRTKRKNKNDVVCISRTSSQDSGIDLSGSVSDDEAKTFKPSVLPEPQLSNGEKQAFEAETKGALQNLESKTKEVKSKIKPPVPPKPQLSNGENRAFEAKTKGTLQKPESKTNSKEKSVQELKAMFEKKASNVETPSSRVNGINNVKRLEAIFEKKTSNVKNPDSRMKGNVKELAAMFEKKAPNVENPDSRINGISNVKRLSAIFEQGK